MPTCILPFPGYTPPPMWSPVEKPPKKVGRLGSVTVSVGRKIYSLSGRKMKKLNGYTEKARIWNVKQSAACRLCCYDIDSNESTSREISGDFIPSFDSAFAVSADQVYIFGGMRDEQGHTNVANNDVFEISLKTGRCKRLFLGGDLPFPRGRHSGWMHDGKLIFHGGLGLCPPLLRDGKLIFGGEQR